MNHFSRANLRPLEYPRRLHQPLQGQLARRYAMDDGAGVLEVVLKHG